MPGRDVSLRRRIEGRELIVICGSGGVGKTTLAAALALELSRFGKRSLVVTIDPARRLANALGLASLSDQPEKIKKGEGKGELWAMMLDAKSTFDRIISRYAPSGEARDRILGNRLYQHLSTSLAGSQEYMAVEAVCELARKSDFDVIVLDTPPTHHALDFLNSPKRLMNFLEEGVVTWFFKPYFAFGKIGMAFMARGGGKVLRGLERLTGFEFLQDLSAFFLEFREMYEGFKERAEWVYRQLQSDQTLFLAVTSPERQSMREVRFLAEELQKKGMSLGGILLNKMHVAHIADARVESLAENALPEFQPLFKDMLTLWRQFGGLIRHDQRCLDELGAYLNPSIPIITLPHLVEELDFKGLGRMGELLFSEK